MLEAVSSQGNTTLAGGVGNVYDFENRLLQHGGIIYKYGGDGNRLTKTVGNTRWSFLNDDAINWIRSGVQRVFGESND
jgi:hypothetical protein